MRCITEAALLCWRCIAGVALPWAAHCSLPLDLAWHSTLHPWFAHVSPFWGPPPIRLRDKEAKLQEKIGELSREHKQVKLLANQVGGRRAGLWVGVAEDADRWTCGRASKLPLPAWAAAFQLPGATTATTRVRCPQVANLTSQLKTQTGHAALLNLTTDHTLVRLRQLRVGWHLGGAGQEGCLQWLALLVCRGRPAMPTGAELSQVSISCPADRAGPGRRGAQAGAAGHEGTQRLLGEAGLVVGKSSEEELAGDPAS